VQKRFSRERDGNMQHRGVIEAQEWSAWLVQRESRGPGDLPNAMKRLEARYGIPSGVLRSLRYKNPEDILLSIYEKIRDAYLCELERQQRAAEHQAAIVRAAIEAAENVGRPQNPHP
jgi:hypothetical protein